MEGNIRIKKEFGQHFLRDSNVIDSIISAVKIDDKTSIFEIGCGDGVLTSGILTTKAKRLWVFEIDSEWAEYVKKNFGKDKRLTVYTENFLDLDFSRLEENAPWTLLANLPYQVTFPILHHLQQNAHLLTEGVIMVQEEVAQKIVKKSGRGYGYPSLFFQYFFEWKLLNKVAPTSFCPPPKVQSRLMYFKPKSNVAEIPDAQNFWKFIKLCFKSPRRTLLNNLKQTHYDYSKISEETLKLRSQQMGIDDFLALWNLLR